MNASLLEGPPDPWEMQDMREKEGSLACQVKKEKVESLGGEVTLGQLDIKG